PDESGATASTADASEGAAPLDLSVRSDHPAYYEVALYRSKTICRSGGGAPPATRRANWTITCCRVSGGSLRRGRTAHYEPDRARAAVTLAAETRRQSQQLLSCHRHQIAFDSGSDSHTSTAAPLFYCHRLDVKLRAFTCPPATWQPALLTCGAPLPDSLAFP
uniref:PRKCSH_1 domain-containing protein n=1 Tax=Macrostomum lignano TaxID=282301 RepID=A0A1I8FCX1_9PLAT